MSDTYEDEETTWAVEVEFEALDEEDARIIAENIEYLLAGLDVLYVSDPYETEDIL